MDVRVIIFLLGIGIGMGQGCFAKVQVAPVAAKPAVPAIGVAYTLGQLWSLINTSNPMQTSNFILASLKGQPMQDAAQTKGVFPDGSVSADRVNFGGVTINRAWIQANQGVRVQLQMDQALVSYLAQRNRVSAADVDRYGQLLKYFVLGIGGVNYRFYLNDPYPGGIQGKVNPARAIIRKWDFQRSYRP